ncbi:MAG: hypothetical protein ACI4P0_02195 [Mailhella sp.]
MITKLAEEVISKPEGRFQKALGVAGKMAVPAFTAYDLAHGISSGEQSVGEAVGSNAGMLAGYELGSRAANKLWSDDLLNKRYGGKTDFGSRAKNFLLRRARGMFGVPLLASMAAAPALGYLGDKIAPWKRKTQNAQPVYSTL